MSTQVSVRGYGVSLREEPESLQPSTRLNVAVLLDSISSQYGGPAYSVRRLWESALGLGASVAVHSTDSFSVAESPEDEKLWGRLNHQRWPPLTVKTAGYSKQMARGIDAAVANGSSVISQHGLWLHYGRVARNVGSKRGVPVIIHPHGMLEPWALRRSRWKKEIAGRLWEFENLKKAACLRVTSSSELESVRRFGLKSPVALIPNGIDAGEFSSLPSRVESEKLLPALKGKRILLFLSRVHPKKGLVPLLKTWHALARERQDWTLVVAGPDQLGHTDELKQLNSKLGLGDAIVFTGAIFGKEKLAAYALADIFLLPSHSENFGVAVAEALAAGVPVVAGTGTPWSQVRDHNCGWWTEITVAALAETLREATSTSKRDLLAMGERGREWMKRDFAWDRLAAQMIEVCEWTLARDSSPPSCVAVY